MPPVGKAPCHNYTPVPNILPSLSLQYCAVCIIQTRIERFKATQIALALRGGVFESSTKGPQWSTIDGPTRKQVSHKDLLNKWRAAKINCCKLVEALEKLCDEKPEMVDEWGLDEALYLWELEKDECSRVPGYKYFEHGSAKNGVKKEMELEDLPQAKESVSKQAPEEEEVSEEDWATVKQKWQRRSSLSGPQLQSEPETLNVEEIAESDMIEVTDGIEYVNISTGELSKTPVKHTETSTALGTGAAEDPKTTPHRYSPKLDEPRNPAPSPVVAEPKEEVSPSTPRSALKHRPSASPLPRKSVTIEPEATILPTEDTPLTTSPHNEHTIAEKRHARPTYQRSSGLYKASTWASPEGYEKLNTSHFKLDWTVMERMQRLQQGHMIPQRVSKEELEVLVDKYMTTAERNKREEARRQPYPFRKTTPDLRQAAKSRRNGEEEDTKESLCARLDALENTFLKAKHMRGVPEHLCPTRIAMREEKKQWIAAESER